MSDMDLSICIVNWNGRELLRQCLESIRKADMQGLSVQTIVVDNGSSDESADMVDRSFPEVTVLRNPGNAGCSQANNQAAAASQGRWILFLNNDTVVGRDSLRQLVEFMRAHPDVGMAGPRLIGADGRPQISYRARPTLSTLLHCVALVRLTRLFRRAYNRYRRAAFDPETLRPVESLLGAAVCLPREVFFRHRGWDEGFVFGMEDVDLSARVAKTHQVVFFPGAEITHLGSVSSRANSGYVYTNIHCGYVRFLRKQGSSRWTLRLYKSLVTLNIPLALLCQAVAAARHRLRHGPASARQMYSQVGSIWHFLVRGLGQFWRA
jgi:N-acetylglucosaminyl-diphospho-decaprenol L-rhamnosyltransferase